MSTVLRLFNEIIKVAPIRTVSSDGEISFYSEATPQQRLAAKGVVDRFDWSAPDPEEIKLETDKQAMQALADKLESTGDLTNGDYKDAVKLFVKHWKKLL